LIAVSVFFAVYQLTAIAKAIASRRGQINFRRFRRGEKELVEGAWNEESVVLGYDVHGKPWLWNDDTRVMQALVLGQSGTGKTTLLRNIITQDLMRRVGPAGIGTKFR
jgi:Cdc6-like AAA superfamily ATPase